MSADIITLPVIRIERTPDENAGESFCLGCLVTAISNHQRELFAWLKAGGDTRLLEFSPLNSWGEILKLGAKLNKQTDFDDPLITGG